MIEVIESALQKAAGEGMDETSRKIIDATMTLIREKGYAAMTTKDIARLAGVNECTLFRKFQNKKEIVLQGVAQEKWRANVTPDILENVRWELGSDLEMFMNAYMDQITPDFVKLSIGLRAPQLYEETAAFIMKVPQVFVTSLTEYFRKMEELGRIGHFDFESLAMTVFSSTFGYTFLSASFGKELAGTERDEYIKNSVKVFMEGILGL